MKRIRKDELFRNVGTFLKDKGIELGEGSYSNTIRSCCGMLTDAVNLSQQGIERARGEVERKLERVRQVIHQKTAPKPPPVSSAKAAGNTTGKKASAAKTKKLASQRGKTAPRVSGRAKKSV